jgi:CxxC-x17-CxxC domain-containing protein
VEEKIAKWSGVIESEQEDIKEEFEAKKLFDAICAQCGKKTKVSFKPDGVRPVYCPECLAAVREKKAEAKAPLPQRPASILSQGETVIRQNFGSGISLDQATHKRPTPIRQKKPRKEVNIEELRRTIEESLAQKNTNSKGEGEE